MNDILFKEEPMKDLRYIKEMRNVKLLLIIFISFFSFFILFGLIIKEYILSIILFIFVVCVLIILIMLILQNRQYLYIYKDKIVYQKSTKRDKKEILINVTDYTIKLVHVPSRGHNFKFRFIDSSGNKLFEYTPLSLRVSPYQTEKEKWEIDIFNIGCKIDNSDEVIYNVKSYIR